VNTNNSLPASPAGHQSALIPSARIKAGPITYVALGDSTGVGIGARNGGYVKRLASRLELVRPQSRVMNLCVSGAATPDLIRSQLGPAIRANPDLITVGIGINDIGHGVGVEQFAKNFDEIIKKLRAETIAVILVSNLPDISSSLRVPVAMRAQSQVFIAQYNQRLQEIATRNGVAVFDVYTLTHNELPRHPEYFSADGFHPSDEGYQLWADHMWPLIEPLLK
jgi:acyl-CoA thioesterase I